MSRLILLLLLAAVIAAAAVVVASVFASGKSADGSPSKQINGVQKVAFGVLTALMFAMGAGALGDV